MKTPVDVENNTKFEQTNPSVISGDDQPSAESITQKTSNQINKKTFDFESAKSFIEFVSVVLALLAIIGTGLIKLISCGRVAYFAFDINHYDFTLNHTDLVVFIVFICAGALTLLYCIYTNNFRNNISHYIINCKSIPSLISIILNGIFNIIWFILLPLAELLIVSLLSTQLSVLDTMLDELPYVIVFSTIVLGAIVFAWINCEKRSITYSIVSIVLIIILALSMMQSKYDEARNQCNFDIITYSSIEENNNDPNYYVVISTGEYYSAYRCDIIDEGEYNKLIVYKNNHRFFAVDSVTTETMSFYTYNEELQKEEPYIIYV